MKVHVQAFLLVASCVATAICGGSETPESAIDLLEKAFTFGSKAGYIAECSHPSLPGCAQLTKAVYYRCPQSDGSLLLRADYHDGEGLCWSLWENEDGVFASHAPTGLTVRGECFQPLYQLESLNTSPWWEEFNYATFQISATQYRSYSAWRIVCQTKTKDEHGNPLSSQEVLGLPAKKTGAFSDFPRHPFIREYVIERSTCAILSLKKFGLHGDLLFHRDLGRVTLAPDWTQFPNLFASPDKLDGEVHGFVDFRQFVRERQTLLRVNRHRTVQAKWMNFISSWGCQFLAILGCLFLGISCWLRLRP